MCLSRYFCYLNTVIQCLSAWALGSLNTENVLLPGSKPMSSFSLVIKIDIFIYLD